MYFLTNFLTISCGKRFFKHDIGGRADPGPDKKKEKTFVTGLEKTGFETTLHGVREDDTDRRGDAERPVAGFGGIVREVIPLK